MGSQAGACRAGVLKKSAMRDRAARELAGRSARAVPAGVRPARASVTSAARGPVVVTRVTLSVMVRWASRS